LAQLSRRNFLKWAGAGAIGMRTKTPLRTSLKEQTSSQEESQAIKIQKYNHLGKTGLEISDIGFGAINYFNPNVLRYAFDLGVTYFDTAEAYMRTMSETYLGQTLKDVRRKVVISTKHAISAAREMERNAIIRRIEGSLKRLQTDYIDIVLIHQVSDPAVLANEEILAAYDRLKKEGKVRFSGFSTHVAERTFPPLLETASYDVVLFVYNHLEGPSIETLVDQVRAKGIGTVAMKALAGNKQGDLKSLVNAQTKYAQAALGWVLANPHIDSCLITMNTFSHVEKYVAASGKPLDRASLETLSKYRSEAGNLYCRVSCRDCLKSCPQGVAINEVLRYAMYFEDYRMEKCAVDLYGGLTNDRKPVHCEACPAPCTGACPFDVPIQERLLHAHLLLSA
jgi:aryl-alcohol dehydrogenase-like predicted oxidoreductase